MARREEPINPGLGPVPSFAHDLRKLRDAAGAPGYRVLAARAHFSSSALSAAARGVMLPTWPVTRAFVVACGGDETEWRQRWEEATALLAASDDPRASEPTATKRVATSPPPPFPPPAVPPAPGHHVRGNRLVILLAVLVLISPPLTTLVFVRTLMGAPGSRGAPTMTPAPVGLSCAPQGVVALPATPATDVARTRMAFEPGGLIWGPYWNNANVHERLVADHPFQGHSALEVRVGPGLGAVGTVHLDDDLRPGVTVTVRLWYGGQGEGQICPFVQGPDYLIRWVPVAALKLSPTVTPGWRILRWRMPAVPRHGIGLQLNNTGAGDLVVELDAIQW